MKIDMIVLDLDGTLLTSEKTISERNYTALEQAAKRGVHIVPSTGRFYDGMPQVVRDLPFVRYVISINGAEIYDVRTRKVLYSSQIPMEQAEEVFDVLDTLPVVYDCFQNGWAWMAKEMYNTVDRYISDPTVLEMVQRLRTPVDGFRTWVRAHGIGVQKIQMFFADMDARAAAMSMLRYQFPDLNVTSSITNNIELNSPNAHKGAALLELCRQLGVDVRAVMAFGDGLNDVTMLRTAGIGVSMKNADVEVKAAADYVTDTNDNDGVAKAIWRFCFGRE